MSEARVKRGPKPITTREQAWEYLLLLLGRQAYTLAELRRKLERRGAGELADELLARLVELRLADDAAYAEQYVAARSASRGRMALARELRAKGVDAELVGTEVGKLPHAQQVAAARELLERNAWRYRPQPGTGDGLTGGAGGSLDAERAAFEALRRAKAKAFAFLARRGFEPDAVAEAIGAVGWFGQLD